MRKKIRTIRLLVIAITMLLIFGCTNPEYNSRAYKKVNTDSLEDVDEFFSIQVREASEIGLNEATLMKSIKTEQLEYWPNCSLVCYYTNLLVEDDFMQKPWMRLYYLLDEDSNVLFDLNFEESNIAIGFLDVKEVAFADIDEDGLTDIVVLELMELTQVDRQQFLRPTIFFQRKEGFFRNAALDSYLKEGNAKYVGENRLNDMNTVIEDAIMLMKEDPDFKKFNEEYEKKLQENFGANS